MNLQPPSQTILETKDQMVAKISLPILEERVHQYGTIWEGYEGNFLHQTPTGSVIIAPFYNKEYMKNILVWDPHKLRLLKKIPTDIFWRLWDNYYATLVFQTNEPNYFLVYNLTGKGINKLKNVNLDPHQSFLEVIKVIGSKKFNTVYLMEEYSVFIYNLHTSKNFNWDSEEEILEAYICDDLEAFVLCHEEKVMVYSLDETGKNEEQAIYEINLKTKFACAYLDRNNNELTILTKEKQDDQYEEEKEDLGIYVSKYKLSKKEYELIQEEKELPVIPTKDYFFKFSDENRMICAFGDEILTILSTETGRVLFTSQLGRKLLKIDPKNGFMYLANQNLLQKVRLNINVSQD